MAEFLEDIQSSDKDVRFAAWRAAGAQPASVIPELAGIMGKAGQPGVAKAALEAMTTLTHSVGKDTATPKRAEVAKQLVAVATGRFELHVRAQALRLLSLVGDDDSVGPVAALLANADLREEAIFCIERIPGDVSAKALVAAYPTVAAEFKPRVLAALGHRRLTAGVPHTTAAMRSPNKELALAGARAFGRIGAKPVGQWPAGDTWDARLRWAEQQNGGAEAMAIYKLALAAPEPHIQCAGVIGLGRIGTAEAAAIVFPKLKSPIRQVRLTARQAWTKMAG